ncbi:MAG TPA: hypothetical protein VMT34_02305 [Aggregatilineales bacterium]|nr:hypothetical protein [Aggregatilineales bacterium]
MCKRILVATVTVLMLLASQRKLVRADKPTSLETAFAPRLVRWSADGTVFAAGGLAGTTPMTQIWNADGTPVTTLNNVALVSWSPSKNVFTGIRRRQNIGQIGVWSSTGDVVFLLAEYSTRDLVPFPFWSPDGSYLVITAQHDSTVVLINSDGTYATSLPSEYGIVDADFGLLPAVVWSPDGKTIASVIPSPAGRKSYAIQLWDLDGKPIHTFDHVFASIEDLAFSPDGAYVIGVINRRHTDSQPLEDVLLWKSDGTFVSSLGDGQVTVSSNSAPVLWSPDGKKVAWFAYRNQRVVLVLHDVAAQQEIPIDAPVGDDFVWLMGWSPDSQRLGVGAQHSTRIYNADGTLRASLSANPVSPSLLAWRPDGQAFVIVGAPTEMVDLDAHVLMTFDDVGQPFWSPDGTRLITLGQKTSVLSLWSIEAP